MVQHDKVFAMIAVSEGDIASMSGPKETINRALIGRLADTINQNQDALPIKKKSSTDVGKHGINYSFRLEINLISDEELKRLQEIEEAYNSLIKINK